MSDDERAIEAIIQRQFGSLNWSATERARWSDFTADFFPDAVLYPAARPPAKRTPEEFIERMKGLADSTLRTFAERKLGHRIQVFGNIAVAVAGCAITANGSRESRSVEMMLLVKDDGAWRIVAQAWEAERREQALPRGLLA